MTKKSSHARAPARLILRRSHRERTHFEGEKNKAATLPPMPIITLS
jgi:hypothetical protein